MPERKINPSWTHKRFLWKLPPKNSKINTKNAKIEAQFSGRLSGGCSEKMFQLPWNSPLWAVSRGGMGTWGGSPPCSRSNSSFLRNSFRVAQGHGKFVDSEFPYRQTCRQGVSFDNAGKNLGQGANFSQRAEQLGGGSIYAISLCGRCNHCNKNFYHLESFSTGSSYPQGSYSDFFAWSSWRGGGAYFGKVFNLGGSFFAFCLVSTCFQSILKDVNDSLFWKKISMATHFFPKNVHSCSKIKYDAVGWDFWTKSSAFLAQGLPMMPRYAPSQPLPVANTFSPQSTLDGSYHWCGLVVSFVLQCKPENTGMLPWQGFLRFFPPHNRSSSRSVPMLFFLIRTIQASASCFSRQHQLTQPTNPSPNRWGLVFLEGFRPGFFLTRTGPGGGSSPGLVLAQSPLPLPHCVHFSHCSCWSASLKGTLIMHSILWQMISFRFKKLTCFFMFYSFKYFIMFAEG